MTPELITLGTAIGLAIADAVLHGHAPRLWKLLGPVITAAEAVVGVKPPPTPEPPPAPSPVPAPLPKAPPDLLAALARLSACEN